MVMVMERERPNGKVCRPSPSQQFLASQLDFSIKILFQEKLRLKTRNFLHHRYLEGGVLEKVHTLESYFYAKVEV